MGIANHEYISMLVVTLLFVGVVGVVGLLLRVLIVWRHLQKRSMVFLVVTPPTPGPSSFSMKRLFSVLYGQRTHPNLTSRTFNLPVCMSFEILSTHMEGIRYLIQVERARVSSVKRALITHIPGARIEEVNEIGSNKKDNEVIYEFKQTGHQLLPLQSADTMRDNEAFSYLTNAMGGLSKDETISYQLVISPIRTSAMQRLVAHLPNMDDIRNYAGRSIPYLRRSTKYINTALFALTDMVGEVYHGPKRTSHYPQARTVKDNASTIQLRKPDRFSRSFLDASHDKLTQPLFRTSIRVSIYAMSKVSVAERCQAITAAFDAYMTPPYQSLKRKLQLPGLGGYREYMFYHRMPSMGMGKASILSAGELAGLYHFPSHVTEKADDIVMALSRTLSPPLSLKSADELSIVLGKNVHHGQNTLIGLSEQDRERHLYIIGGTGNGKTTMLQSAIIQDIKSGKGLAVIDPHGDMAETLLRHVPKERAKDVVYFNPDDLDYSVGLNLLELTPGITGYAAAREKDLVTESVISVFRKMFSEEDTGGHRIEYVLRNVIHTALTVEGATIFTILKLLQSPGYRKQVTARLKDEDLKDFWKNELGKAGDMQRVKMSAGITTKLGRFNSNAAARLVLGQSKSTINFDDIMDSGKIVICNFSKGLLGEDVSALFGIMVLAKLQLAGLKRARLNPENRRPFYIYVDEFQNFATPSFVQMLSESRKYKVFLHMAEQSTSQQKDQRMVDIILANVGTVVCFRTGNPHDERLLLPLFKPYIETGEIANLPAYSFYARLSSLKAQEPVSGQTIVPTEMGSKSIAEHVITTSRQNYAVAANLLQTR